MSELGPNSLLWRYLGDRRFVLTLPRAVTLQMLHPAIAAATAEYSLTPTRLWLHKKRTVPQLVGMAYSQKETKHFMRYAHEHMKGRDDRGNRYHALNPELFFFQHATYVDTLVTMITTFIRPLASDELEQLYQETCTWYRKYGISDRMVPATWGEFDGYFDDACRSQLRVSEHFEQYRSQVLSPNDWSVRSIPRPVVRALQHDRARELLGITVSRADRNALWAYAYSRRAGAVVPSIRMSSRARQAMREAETVASTN
ncbi:DUF2236 domain-containing protein [Aldersonia sp. NBC_00410]|uniref:oxygenase MpaB family protein n=1 Tax=Aldersonia sp. NBC_00410 TaxID=2975954 RepID=UPI002257A307|nr:oxygenase MpaB family protein [Aldersonia sp. NBC_00410]MCX5044457.1 DUF2236 domain-containing protein [Aldersonia sp. NBC_00410]